MATLIKKEQCPKCSKEGSDKSKNNLAVYDDGSAYCFAGHGAIRYSKREMEEEIEWNVVDFTHGDHLKLKAATTTNPRGYRGLKEETCKLFGVRHEYDQTTGELVAQYYPNTTNYEFSGYKRRGMPKEFSALGEVGNQNELFGQFRFVKNSSKTVLIVGGEVDQLSAYQMLRDYQVSREKTDYDPVPVVSPVAGESGCLKQIQAQYEWFDRFEKIILCFDNDPIGKASAEKLIRVLPRGKVYLADMKLKDPNEYLVEGKAKDFLKVFYDAKKYTPAGIVGSGDLMTAVVEASRIMKIPLPEFLNQLERAMAGGIPLKKIVNILAGSGIGKTTLIDSLVLYWIFNSPYKVGIVSLEVDKAEYASNVLSMHIGRKLSLFEDPDALEEYLGTDYVVDKANALFKDDGGDDRFYLIDDRGDTGENIKKKIEDMIIKCGCQLIVIDPLSDLMAGMSNEEQELFMTWQKQITKSHDVTLININHTRKGKDMATSASRGADLSEEDIIGTSSIYKSGAANITLVRNKHAEDMVERNSTRVTMTKCRWTGVTGPMGEIFYENETHRLWDKVKWLQEHPQNF